MKTLRVFLGFVFSVIFMHSSQLTGNAVPFAVQSLFDADSVIVGSAIPFHIESTVPESFTIQYVAPEISPDACQTVVDFFSPSVFHVKCVVSVSALYLRISVRQNTKDFVFRYGPIPIKSKEEVILKLDSDPDEPPGPPADWLAGKTIWDANCTTTCHTPVSKTGRTAAQITSAIATYPQMNFLTGVLSAQQLSQIEVYLGDPSAY